MQPLLHSGDGDCHELRHLLVGEVAHVAERDNGTVRFAQTVDCLQKRRTSLPWDRLFWSVAGNGLKTIHKFGRIHPSPADSIALRSDDRAQPASKSAVIPKVIPVKPRAQKGCLSCILSGGVVS